MNARAEGIAGMYETESAVESRERRARRLAIAGRVAGGLAALPGAWDCTAPEKDIALSAWNIAGHLLNLAESGGC